jgi:hypothetical protein
MSTWIEQAVYLLEDISAPYVQNKSIAPRRLDFSACLMDEKADMASRCSTCIISACCACIVGFALLRSTVLSSMMLLFGANFLLDRILCVHVADVT